MNRHVLHCIPQQGGVCTCTNSVDGPNTRRCTHTHTQLITLSLCRLIGLAREEHYCYLNARVGRLQTRFVWYHAMQKRKLCRLIDILTTCMYMYMCMHVYSMGELHAASGCHWLVVQVKVHSSNSAQVAYYVCSIDIPHWS